MLKSIVETQGKEIHLVKPDVAKKFYVVSDDEFSYATIDLIHGQGSLARLETVDGSYTVKRQGFFVPYVTIRKENTEQDLAMCFLDLSGRSTLCLEDCRCSFRALSLWKNQWGWFNEKNRPMIKYFLSSSGMTRGDVEFSKDFAYLQNADLLVALGAYFILQLEDELRYLSENK